MRWLIGSQPWQSSVLTDSERVDADCSEGLSGTIDGLYPGGGLRFPIWSHNLSDAAQRVLLVGEPCSHSAVPGAARQSRRLAGHER